MTPNLKEDHHGVIPYQAPRLSFDAIETQLAELLELRETAEAEGELPETLAVIDKQISEYMAREIKKVDGICHAVRTYEMAAEHDRKESERLTARAKAFEARVERIKETAKAAMLAHGVRVIETPEHTLRVQGNGGLQPLQVLDQTLLAEHFRTATVTMSLRLLRSICKDLSEVECREIYKTETSVDSEALRIELKRGPIVGARLLERGTHLRIS